MSGGVGDDPLEARLVAELPRLRAFLRRLGGADCEDLSQEVMAKALRYRDSFDESRALGPWLRVAALRIWMDHRDRAQREPAVLGELDPAAVPEGDLEDGELLQVLLARLATVERAVLLRFHRDGETIREVAAALGLPEGTVKSHLHRARRKLAALDPEELR